MHTIPLKACTALSILAALAITLAKGAGWLRAAGFLLLSMLAAGPALAWNAGGHRIVALIAWEAMDAETRTAAGALLRRHPDFARWQERGGEGDAERAAFLEASTWPDDIRKDPRFYTAGSEVATPTPAGFPDMERRLSWHYVDLLPESAKGGAGRQGEIDRQLTALAETLGSAKESAAARAYALPWLIHLVGDAHQPLHTASRYRPDGQSDNGGNDQAITNPFDSRSPATNLHRYWDDLPAPPWLRGSRLESAVSALISRYPRPALPSTSGQWIEESRQLARRTAYPAESDEVPTISSQFHQNALEVARRRVVEAGHRLADLLRGLLAGKGNGGGVSTQP